MQFLDDSDELKGLGCGNVARVSKSKYVSVLGAKLVYVRKGYRADRVSSIIYPYHT